MKDWLYLGEVPANEDVAAVGSDDYMARSRKECNALIGQLRRNGNEPAGARLKIKSNPHDFGTYLTVEVQFDDNSPAAVEYAYALEENFPENWDEQAKKELLGEPVLT